MPRAAPPTTAGKPRRRTQEERRTATRAALLDATIDCLVEYGYAGVTTTRVVERAGVSRGAQVHHFPTKAALVTEAVGHLARRQAAEIADDLDTLPNGAKRLEAVLDLLWRSHAGPLFQAALELWVAARTDPELAEALVDFDREVNLRIWEGAGDLFGDVSRNRRFREDLEMALAVMRGLALLLARGVDAAAVERRWRVARSRILADIRAHA